MLWIGTPSAASIQGMGMNGSSGSGSHCNISASPFENSTPALTRATRWGALTRRQRSWAAINNFQAIARPAFREPAPLVFFVRAFTVANVDSMGLVVRKCTQCWAGKL